MIPAYVTTFGPEYYERFGREAILSMAPRWPGRMIAYGEGKRPADLPEQVEYRDLFDQPDFANFVDWTGKVPFLRGILPDGRYEYHFNMHKFGRKAFVVSDMKEPFFFVGADVHAVKEIPAAFLTGMLDGKFGAFLFRGRMHTESDFAGYNTAHPKWAEFARHYRSVYVNGSVLLLLREKLGLHDCWSLDCILRDMELVKECHDITKGVKGDDPNGFHVWPKTALAEYMVHLKGRIKKDPAKKAEALKGAA